MDRCILCGGPGVVDCPACIERYAMRHAVTRADLRRGLEWLATGVTELRDATTYIGPDGPRRLIRELLPGPPESLATRDILTYQDLLLRFGAERSGSALLSVEFHGRDEVAAQVDVLSKELTVLAEMVSMPSAHYAFPVHLRQVLVAAALIWHLTDPDTDHAHRLGVGLARKIEGLRFRSAEVAAWCGDDALDETRLIAEIIENLMAFGELSGLRRTGRRRPPFAGLTASETELVAQAFGGALRGSMYTALSSAAHGQRRHGFALADELADLRPITPIDSAQDLLALVVREGMDALVASAVAVRAYATYTGSRTQGTATHRAFGAIMHLRYVCQREADLATSAHDS